MPSFQTNECSPTSSIHSHQEIIFNPLKACTYIHVVVFVVQRFGVGLVIERSLVRLPAGALSRQLD